MCTVYKLPVQKPDEDHLIVGVVEVVQPRPGDHDSVMVHVQARHLVRLLPEHEEHGVHQVYVFSYEVWPDAIYYL